MKTKPLLKHPKLPSRYGLFNKTLFTCVSIGFTCYLIRENLNVNNSRISRPEALSSDLYNNEVAGVPPKIVLGIVSCRQVNDSSSTIETVVMIKSVLISAILHNVTEMEFHIFLEWAHDEQYFRDAVRAFQISEEVVQISMYFHSAVDIVPQKFHDWMVYHKRFRCGFSRMFFPTALPDVDSILYLDTDFIVTGSILDLWNHLGKMKGRQSVGAVANNAPESLPVSYHLHECFNDVPFVHPKGLNSGLMLMNLTRLRMYDWVDKASYLFETYTKMAMVDDQRLLNIILYFDSGLLHLLPCQFNIRCSPCDHGFICREAYMDPIGIQLVHGANNQFDKKTRFYYLYRLYKMFDMATQDIRNDLLIPVKKAKEPRTKKGEWKCDPSVNDLLYLDILDEEDL